LKSEVQARQTINAETGLALARDQGCSWLVHLDNDELFFTGSLRGGAAAGALPQAPDHFDELDREGVLQMTYMNHEGVPETLEVLCS
jgi:hypothetical protein